MALVLKAAGIEHVVLHRDGLWLLAVPDELAERAGGELEAYRDERVRAARVSPTPLPSFRGGVVGSGLYAAVLVGVAGLAHRDALGVVWQRVGKLQAGRFVEGEWWRALTALTLHLDAAHLVANLGFGLVFGLLAARMLGGGVAWLAILLAGALGNALNAVLQPPNHAALGASTAVFGALGILVALAVRYRRHLRESPLRRWSPLVVGLVLLAYTGMGGERTDVLAHLTGMASGLLLGTIAARIPSSALGDARLQRLAAAAALALIVGAWSFALSLARQG
jgi:membrane associated rhomboid family serine protease